MPRKPADKQLDRVEQAVNEINAGFVEKLQAIETGRGRVSLLTVMFEIVED